MRIAQLMATNSVQGATYRVARNVGYFFVRDEWSHFSIVDVSPFDQISDSFLGGTRTF